MENDIISELAAAIATRRCVLFAGAGLTANSGGSTWDDLVNNLKDEFNYSSPLNDKFQIMGDMFRKYNPEIIYGSIQKKLENARIEEPVSKLMTLPWFTTFTTNYDIALEKSLDENQSLLINTVVTGHEFILEGFPSEMLCVKLMGSSDLQYGQPGSMVLAPGDLVTAEEERSKIFDKLASHAAKLSFLFIGYSFDDGLFIKNLDKIMQTIGKPNHTFYALFRKKPDEEKSYLLEQYGVEIIIGNLDDFSNELSKEVAIRNPSDYTLKRIPIGSDIVPIDSTKVSSFLSLYNPVLFEDLEEQISPKAFFKGNTESFKPFNLNWHFQRKEMKEVVDAVLKNKGAKDEPCIITIEGNPGSGRKFVMLASIYDLIINNRTIALKISNNSINPIPSLDDITEFLDEVERTSKERNIKSFERVVIWAQFTPDHTVISQFKKLSSTVKYPICFIFKTIKISSFEKSKDIISINADSKMSHEQKEELGQYILKITRDHKFPEIDKEETIRIVNEEKKFLPIMYRTIDPARRSINEIIEQEFNQLDDQSIKKCICMCALSTSVEIDIPISVLRRALGNQIGKSLSYPDVFEITKNAKSFIIESEDIRTNILFSIYHMVIAQHIVKLVGKNNIDEYLLSIAKTVDLRSRKEAEFIGTLLISKGVNYQSGKFKPYTNDGLEAAFQEIKNRQPARPILHHLARLYEKKDAFDDNIIPLLKEALAEPSESYSLEERKENIMTTLAKVKWEQKKDYLSQFPRDYPETQNIIDLLIRSREKIVTGAHTYDVHARILKDLWHSKNDEEKLPLINEALDMINEGLDYCSDNPDCINRLNELKIESLSEIDPIRAKDAAKSLLENANDGSGFYTLALIEYQKNSNPVKSSLFLDYAMSGEKCPVGAIALKIEILLQDKFPNYESMLKPADLLSSDIGDNDTWKSDYHKAVIYTINNRYLDAAKYFKLSFRKAPRTLQRHVQIFWMEMAHRKTHTGKIGRPLTESEGNIYSHNIGGWNDTIFFKPISQKYKNKLKSGLFVDFELGFSPRGPIAWDVRPHEKTIQKK